MAFYSFVLFLHLFPQLVSAILLQNGTIIPSNCTSDCGVPSWPPISPPPTHSSWSDFLQTYTIHLLVAVSVLGLVYGKRKILTRCFSRDHPRRANSRSDEESGVHLEDVAINGSSQHQEDGRVTDPSVHRRTDGRHAQSVVGLPSGSQTDRPMIQYAENTLAPVSEPPVISPCRTCDHHILCHHQPSEDVPPSGLASGLTSGAASTLVNILGG
ncbi:hypothetical protein VTL71DRAFT_14079 [Oculimacula yallundae]|uniref:Uncharacterized protein n=1 Tax=Oculimacula yallundae TaxID=86028 RepID=A0ABR4CI56_9HELO